MSLKELLVDSLDILSTGLDNWSEKMKDSENFEYLSDDFIVMKKLISFDTLPKYEEVKKLSENRASLINGGPHGHNKLISLLSLIDENNIYEMPSEEFVSELAKFLKGLHEKYNSNKPIVEVCAGNGKLSHHLKKKGIDIRATDDYSLDEIKRTDFVEKLNHTQALKKYNPEIVLASWIPYESELGFDILKHDSVKHLITIGDGPGGCCGSDKIHEYKGAKSRLIEEISKYSLSRMNYSEVRLFDKLKQK